MKNLIKPEIVVPLVIVIAILGFLLIGGTMNKGSHGEHGQSHGNGEVHSQLIFWR